jgi:hypothetical protein
MMMTVRAAIVLEAIAGLALGLPGHLSVDSVIQLFEARTLQFVSYHPPMMSLLLRTLDTPLSATVLFVVVDQALLTASFILLLGQRRPAGWLAAIAAAVVVLNPLVIAYTGIVWKDVLMAHVAVFGYACLDVASRRSRGSRRMAWAIAALLSLAMATSLRQHALVLAIPGAVYVAVLLTDGRLRRASLARGLAAAIVGANAAIVAYADAIAVSEKVPRTALGLRALATFDLVGIAAGGGAIPNAAVARDASDLVPSYTALQLGMLAAPPGSELWVIGTSDLLALWARSVAASPGAYLSHRAAHLGNLLWRPCFVMLTGVPSTVYVPALGRDIMPELGLRPRWNRRDSTLMEAAEQLRDTPLFNPVFWSIALVVGAMILALRRTAAALVILAASTLVFVLGFGVIGISCDLRYVYILPVAATMLLFVLALTSGPTAAGKPAVDSERHVSGAR